MKVEIRNRWTDDIIFQAIVSESTPEYDVDRKVVEQAVRMNINLKNANLSGANLREAYLYKAKLHGADLTDVDLSGAYLAQSDLSCADLQDAFLKNCCFHKCDLTGSMFSFSNQTIEIQTNTLN